MSSSTSFLVIRLSDASSGHGSQNPGGLEPSRGFLDHLLVDRWLSEPHRIGYSLGGRLPVGNDHGLADAQQDRAASGVRVDLLTELRHAPADQQASDRRDRARFDGVADSPS